MARFTAFITLAITFGFHSSISAASDAKIEIIEHCDIPQNNLKSIKNSNPQDCAKACQDEPKCLGFSFISHWNRCFLKSKVKRKFTIEMHAGQVLENKAAERKMGPISRFADSTGKDLKILYGLKSVEACVEKCLARKDCLSFNYMVGYASCVLKKERGKIVEKKFYCGEKAETTITRSLQDLKQQYDILS